MEIFSCSTKWLSTLILNNGWIEFHSVGTRGPSIQQFKQNEVAYCYRFCPKVYFQLRKCILISSDSSRFKNGTFPAKWVSQRLRVAATWIPKYFSSWWPFLLFSNSAFVNNNNNSNSNDNNNSSSNNRTSSAILYQDSSVSVCFGVLKAATGPDLAGTSTTRISIQVSHDSDILYLIHASSNLFQYVPVVLKYFSRPTKI